MSLKSYFESQQGLGVLSTADGAGRVDAAIYARPHVIDESTVCFIMADGRSHRNLLTNPRAAYLFRAGSTGYEGKRLYLHKIAEDTDRAKIDNLRRGTHGGGCPADAEKARYLVTFRIDEIRPLVGDGESSKK
jgi:hypothetical protein